MSRIDPTILIVVPGQRGGIDRLFEPIFAGRDSRFRALRFVSHGPSRWHMIMFPVRFAAFFATLIRRRPDICHLNISVSGSTLRKGAMAFMCLALGIPYVLHFHGGPYPAFMNRLPELARSTIRFLFARADRVIVLGEVWRSYVTSNLGVAPDRVDVIYNGLQHCVSWTARRRQGC
jgi:glycosyltransferase involved in cell wall biosynthesis